MKRGHNPIALLFITATAWSAASAFAADPTPHIDQRAVNQQERVLNGEASGALTNREAAHLDARESKLQGDIAAAKADGKVTAGERTHLRREENRDSRAIYRKKHNLRTR